MKTNRAIIGLVDADLLDGGTRHPNLALLKIAGFLYDNSIEFELIEDSKADISNIVEYIYLKCSPLQNFLNFIIRLNAMLIMRNL